MEHARHVACMARIVYEVSLETTWEENRYSYTAPSANASIVFKLMLLIQLLVHQFIYLDFVSMMMNFLYD
jgi:hypothetical protein